MPSPSADSRHDISPAAAQLSASPTPPLVQIWPSVRLMLSARGKGRLASFVRYQLAVAACIEARVAVPADLQNAEVAKAIADILARKAGQPGVPVQVVARPINAARKARAAREKAEWQRLAEPVWRRQPPGQKPFTQTAVAEMIVPPDVENRHAVVNTVRRKIQPPK